MEQQRDQKTQRLPLETLLEMNLPNIPNNLRHLISISWNGKLGIPAPSAAAALTNKNGQPLVTISIIWKQKIIEEQHAFKDAVREFKIFTELAKENLI